ncbi:hypothetical protein [Terrimonas alba]|uniref:hypothetical protein n=1 Tax=Terrimonas alba TaxID=3349636 RepID=UPI0035F42A02
MKKSLLTLLLLVVSILSYSQFIHKIKADSVLITNDSCNAELNLENSTKDTIGFLYNKGNGRTEFRKGVIKLNDTLYIIGSDTLNVPKSISSGDYIKNQNTAVQTADFWISGTARAGIGYFPVITSSGSGDTGNFTVRSGTSINASSIPQLLVEGAPHLSNRIVMRGSTTPVLSTGHAYANIIMGEQGVSYNSSAPSPLIAGLILKPPTAEKTGSGAVTNLATLYIEGSPILLGGLVPTGGSYSIWSKSGLNRFDATTLIGRTSATTLTGTNSTPKLQVTGKSLIDKLVVGPATAEENGILQIYGNTFIGGTSPKIEWENQTLTLSGTSTQGRLLLTSSGTGSAFEIQHNRDNGIIFRMQNVTNGLNSKPPFSFISKDAATLTSGAWPETQGEQGQYFSVNGTHNTSSWGSIASNYLSYFDFYPLNTGTGIVRRTGVSTNPTSAIDNIETLYRNKRLFYPGGSTQGRIIIGTTSDDGTNILQVTGGLALNGKQSIGASSATALLHLGAGAGNASSAPLKFTAGTNLTTPENGAVEYDGTNYFVTSGNTRYTLAKTLTATATLDFSSTAAQSGSNLTITVAGVTDGDAVSLGVPNAAVNDNSSFSAWVSGTNTVTVRFNNYSSTAIDPASGTFRVTINKY